ncbi:MAG: MFS transporter [Planctomycetes bacterium]|nr:MFS transporter [Planctomycetota bacterium]
MSAADSNSSTGDRQPERAHDPYAALRIPGFRWYLMGNLLFLIGINMQTAAISWEIFARTQDYKFLAYVGLVQILPVIGLFMPAGHIIDRVNRKKLLIIAIGSAVLWSSGLAVCSAVEARLRWMYLLLFLIGAARSFLQPARSAFLPQIVPMEVFPNAVTWHSTAFQLSTAIGPALGGLLIAGFNNATAVYVITAAFALFNCLCIARIEARPYVRASEPPSLASLMGGLSFVWKSKVMLAAITLDMFAVLLGGATALLPGFATDVLHAGPKGFGWMRAAPGIGAVVMSLALAHRPPFERAGRVLLLAVAGFGAATIVFGLSRNFALSLTMLLALGALDMISVVIRHTVVQLLTPDAMRGRVSAVNGMFIGISNELGEFESGMVAELFHRPDDKTFGPTVSAVSGGIGTMLVVGLVAIFSPALRKYGRLDGQRPGTGSTPSAGSK